MKMSVAKPKSRILSKPKSKRSSPRQYNDEDLPQFMQPLLQSHNKPTTSGQKQKQRPKSEILQELRRLRLHHEEENAEDDDDDAMKKKIVSPVPSVPIQPINSLKELDALRLTRHRLEQLLNCCSNFEQTVLNCFVRVNINGANVLPEYRIAEIIGAAELTMGYYVGKTPTNKALELRYEDLVVQHELNDISNVAFTDDEFALWHDNCICQGYEFPTTELIARKKIEWYNAFNSGVKITSVLRQSGLIGLSMPMRTVPKGGLLERVGGGVYPWKLQRPAESSAAPQPTVEETETIDDMKTEKSEHMLDNQQLFVTKEKIN